MVDQQGEWRFCHKCQIMFFDGFPTKGACPAGAGHDVAGYNFLLPYDGAETPTDQHNWRFCHKCNALFFDGFPTKGACPAGAGHDAAGYNFLLPHDVAESSVAQQKWRFCHKCNAMFFDGFSTKGACPAGAGHDAAGYNFVIPHVDDTIQAFDSGYITSDLPLGGSAHVVMTKAGSFTFNCHAHDSGFNNIHYTLSAVLMTPAGLAFTFQHQGAVEGTLAGLPFGTPDRDQDFVTSGSNPTIAAEWDRLRGARLVGHLHGTDQLVAGVKGAIDDLLKQVLAGFGKASAAAVVALVL